MEAWLPLLTALIAGMITATVSFVSIGISNQHQENMRRADIKRAKGEILYSGMVQYCSHTDVQAHRLIAFLEQKISYDTYVTCYADSIDNDVIDTVPVGLAARVYFPELEEEYETVTVSNRIMRNLVGIYNLHQLKDLDVEKKSLLLKKLKTNGYEFASARSAFLDKLIHLLKAT